MTLIEEVISGINQAYGLLISSLPSFAGNFINLFLIVALIFIYAVFIWKLHKFISTKNILGLNLNQYNKSSFPFLAKLIAGMFFFIEYIVILPFLIFFWYVIFALFLIFLTEDLSINSILVLSAVIVASVRMTSYIPNYGEKLAADLAKLLPFTLLAVSLLSPGFFNFETILSQLSQLPEFFSQITSYLIFIMILEIILRFFDFVFSLFGLEEEVTEEEKFSER
jgi:hypothetical protein